MLEGETTWRSTRGDGLARPRLTVVRCAWCDDSIIGGALRADAEPPPAAAVSHGLCNDCRLQLEERTG